MDLLPEEDTSIEQSGQAADLLKASPEDPVDLGDWEPTLF